MTEPKEEYIYYIGIINVGPMRPVFYSEDEAFMRKLYEMCCGRYDEFKQMVYPGHLKKIDAGGEWYYDKEPKDQYLKRDLCGGKVDKAFLQKFGLKLPEVK